MRWPVIFLLMLIACLPSYSQSSETVSSTLPALPDAPPSPFAEARRLEQQGNYAEAIAKLQQLGKSDSGMKGLAHELGVAYYQSGDYVKAIEYLTKATANSHNQNNNNDNDNDNDSEDREAIQLLGLANYLAGRPAQAIPLLEKVQDWYPRANIDASYILGVAYIQTQNYAGARKAFARMFEVGTDSAAAYLFTARILLRQEHDPVAEEYAQKAIALDPKLPLAHFFLGELHLYKSKIPEAIADFRQELAINPGEAAAYYKLADAYSRIQKFDDAERLLQRSIWLDSTSTGPYILMGKVLGKKGDAELSVRALQHALAMDPNNPLAHHLLGQAYQDMGKVEDAERERKLAEQLHNTTERK